MFRLFSAAMTPRPRSTRRPHTPAANRPAPAAPERGAATTGTSQAGEAPRPSRGRLAGLDGLRGLAVILVLIYHLAPGILPGGMVGVDAFFVISGFLITSLLLTEWRTTGRINLARFWNRRLRRIVPALLLAVVVVVSLAACLGGDVLLGVRRQVIGAAALAYNWVEIAVGSSYFDLAQPLLLTNVWSLAVEEQFYVIWPLVLIALLHRSNHGEHRRRFALLALALAAVSAILALTLALTGSNPSRIYMGTDTHAFGLMLGAALALWHGHATDPLPPTSMHATTAFAGRLSAAMLRLGRGILGWLGVAGLLSCAIWGSDGSAAGTWEGATTLWLLAASISSVLIVQSLTPEVLAGLGPASLLASIMETAPMRWLGQRSYGLYLWHWPLWVLAFYGLPSTWANAWRILIVAATSILAAEASYRYIETPIRRQGLRGWLAALIHGGPRTVLALSACATCLVLLVGLAFTLQPRHSTAEEAIAEGQRALAAHQPPTQASHTPTPPATPSAMPLPAPSGEQVSLVGDSVSLASASGLNEALPGIAIDAKVSRSFYAALDTLKAMDAQYGARPYVVVSLVTNGTVTDELLSGLLDYLGPGRRLVLVTAFGPARTTWIPGANATLTAFAAAHPQQVAIAGWNSAITGHEDLLAQDQVHPGPEGGRIYAQAVKSALDALYEQGAPAVPTAPVTTPSPAARK